VFLHKQLIYGRERQAIDVVTISAGVRVFEKNWDVPAGAHPGGAIGAISLPITYESNFFHHDFLQCGKQDSRHKVILPSIVLSQQGCEVYL